MFAVNEDTDPAVALNEHMVTGPETFICQYDRESKTATQFTNKKKNRGIVSISNDVSSVEFYYLLNN